MVAVLHPTRKDAYQLLHDGALAFCDIGENGIRLDTEYCEKQFDEIDDKVKKIKRQVEESKLVRTWKKVYGDRFKLTSNDQLAAVLFKHLGYTPKAFTEKRGTPSTKEEDLRRLKNATVRKIIKMKRLERGKKKLMELYRESVNGIMHPQFGLAHALTYRSDCSGPNFHNLDKRDPIMEELIRSPIIPFNPEDCIIEFDYGRIEVHGATWYHKDPNMIDELANPKRDMHRDMARRCYALKRKQMGKKGSKIYKDIRYGGKNKFVFPEFYGDYYESVAVGLWDYARSLQTASGMPMRKHLRKVGLRNLEAYTGHIETVEDYFWQEKFRVYGQWKNDWYNEYLHKGYYDMLSGFRCSAFMKRNEAINYAVQGVAFHCLLWSVIRINRYLKKHKFKSKIIGQIHDSVLINVVPGELEDVIAIVQKIMCHSIKKHWPWIITELEVEAEITAPGESWYKKKEIKLAA